MMMSELLQDTGIHVEKLNDNISPIVQTQFRLITWYSFRRLPDAVVHRSPDDVVIESGRSDVESAMT